TKATLPSQSIERITTAPGCSTISRSCSPQRSSVTASSRPCQTVSAASGCTRTLDERDGDVDHRLEVGDRDPLVGGVDVGHPVGEVHAAETALVERVRVGGA